MLNAREKKYRIARVAIARGAEVTFNEVKWLSLRLLLFKIVNFSSKDLYLGNQGRF